MIILQSPLGDDDRDIERRRSPYLSARERKIIALLFALLILGIAVGYGPCKARRDWVVSQENLRALQSGLLMYAQDNNDGLPPAYEVAAPETPKLDAKQRPLTWATLILGFVEARKFSNPSARPEWEVLISDIATSRRGEAVRLGYGLPIRLSTMRTYEVTNPACVVLAETISNGQEGSLNPLPLKSPQDGFLIGFDDTNLPGTGPNENSQYATRLAFFGFQAGGSISAMKPIHPGRGTLAVQFDGGIRVLAASDQLVTRAGKLPTGLWAPVK